MNYRGGVKTRIIMVFILIVLLVGGIGAAAAYFGKPVISDVINAYKKYQEQAEESKQAEAAKAAEKAKIESEEKALEEHRKEMEKLAEGSFKQEAKETGTAAAASSAEKTHDFDLTTGAYIRNDILTFENHHYIVYRPEDSSENGAKEFCLNQGGYLVSIDSDKERESLVKFLKYLCIDDDLADGITSSGYVICEWEI